MCYNRTHAPQKRASFENLVGAAGQGQRNGYAERTGGHHIDVQLNFSCLLNGQVSGLFTSKNAPGIDARQAVGVGDVRPIAQETASRGKFTILENGWHAMAKR